MGTRVENTPFFEHPGWHYPAGWGVRGSAGWRADGPAGQRRAGGYTGRRVRKSVGQRLSKSAGWLAGGSASRRGGRPVDRRAGWSVNRQLVGSADRLADGPTGRRDGGPAGRRAGDALGPDRELPHEVLPARSITAVLELAHPQLSRQDPRTKLALTPPFPRWPVVKMAPRARCDCGRWSFRMISDECDGRCGESGRDHRRPGECEFSCRRSPGFDGIRPQGAAGRPAPSVSAAAWSLAV